jgi:hypothetical protein
LDFYTKRQECTCKKSLIRTHNQLLEIPPEIGYMRNLTFLDISQNSLLYIPQEIGHLSSLEELRLSGNKLTTIPSSFGLLRALKSLYLDHNLLEFIPSEFGILDHLEVFDLTQNQLKFIPEELLWIEKLKSLVLQNNPLQTDFIKSVESKVASLKELAARVIVRRNINGECSKMIAQYISSAHVCSFCGGPYFDSYQQRVRNIFRDDLLIPLESRLCIDHWNSDQERIKLLFCPLPFTAPFTNRSAILPLVRIPVPTTIRQRLRSQTVVRAEKELKRSPSLPSLDSKLYMRPKDRLLKQISSVSIRLKRSTSSLFARES